MSNDYRWTLTLRDPQTAHADMVALWYTLKPMLHAGHVMTLTAEPERRNGDQNRLLHALLGEIAAKVEWAGKKREAEVWKRLLTAAWLRARGESIEVLPALDGHGIDVVFRPTSKLTKAECTELLEFIQAWAATNGVEFRQMEEA